MSNHRFYHGGDYNPEQWLDRPDILERDIELMRKAHVNLVSVGIFSWSALEPREGEYHLEWLETIVQRLYEAGVHVALATPSGARPAWMAQKYPEVRRVDANRVRQLFGMRHNHCYTSPIYREKVKNINQLLARRLGHHPGVELWHISNELGGECHCPLCQEAFRGWLKQRYGSLDRLNQAWNTRFWSHDYSDWSQIESPAPHGEQAMHGLALDWKRFITHQTLDFFRWERDAIREICPEAKFTTNMMYRFDGLDYFQFAPEVDVISWDNYPTWHKARRSEEDIALDTAMMHDLFYSLKGKPFLMMESTPSVTNWQSVSKVKKPGMQLMSSLQAIAHGSDSVQYFQWRPSRGATEKFHGAVVGHDGREDNRVFQETAAVGRALERLSALAGTLREKQAAIVLDWDSRMAMEAAQGPRNIGLGYWDEVLRHYRGLVKNGWTVDFVNEDSDLEGYRLVVAPMLYLLRESFAERLTNFTRGGGTLVVTYWSGIVDEHDLCWLGDTPHGLTEVLGLRRLEIDGMYDGEYRRCRAIDSGLPETAQGSVLCEVAHAETAAPLMVYDEDFFKDTPAVTEHLFGKGRACYLATRFEPEFYAAFYDRICPLQTRLPEPLAEGLISARRGGALFVQNTLSTPVRWEGETLPPYATLVRTEDETMLFAYPEQKGEE